MMQPEGSRWKSKDGLSATAIFAREDNFLARMIIQFGRLEDRVPSLHDVARTLAVSPRTLRRRLKAHNTSYREILQTVRLEAAKAALVYSSLTVDEIAVKLGYTETTNFRHAFRRWAGASPQSYRQEARARLTEMVVQRAA